MRKYGLVLVSALLAASGTVLAAPPGAATLTPVVAFDPAIGELPESIALDGAGNYYVSTGISVKKVTPSGQATTLATLPVSDPGSFTTGVKFGPDGLLYVGTASLDPTLDSAAVWKVSPATGSYELVTSLDPAGFPNDFAFDRAGNTFVTDPFLGRIYRIDASGTASVWLADPALLGEPTAPALAIHDFGVDGIAFDAQKRHIFVSNLDKGTILKIPVSHCGDAGPVQVFASDPALIGADGIAFDTRQTLYVAVGVQNRIVTVDRFGAVDVFAEGGPLDGPSAFAFGVNSQNKKTLYITNFAISRAIGTQSGVPEPGILKVSVKYTGLSVP